MKTNSIPPFPPDDETGSGLPGQGSGHRSRGARPIAMNHASASSAHSGPGEDPFVESGVPANDPEQPRQTPEEQSTG